MTSNDSPAYVRPEAAAALDDLLLISDLVEGSRQMWTHAKDRGYIRKWSDEDEQVYKIRSTSETVFEGTGRTLSASVGMLYAKPPQLDWNAGEQRIKGHWDNLDMAGTAGHVFTKRFSELAVRDGLAILLVDHAPKPANVQVHDGNEEALGLRPMWAMYPRASAVSWRTTVLNNQETLVQLVLKEDIAEQAGRFGVNVATRYRQLALEELDGGFVGAVWRLWVKNEGASAGEEYRVESEGVFRNRAGQPAPFLPVGVAYTGRQTAPFVVRPPLMGVAWANLAHWRSSTNLEFYRQLCAFPQPTVVGKLVAKDGAEGTLRVGPMVVVHLTEGGEFDWAELSGTSLERLEHGVAEKERHMGQLGMTFLAPSTRQAETAEAKRLDATAENATLATAAQGIDDAINLALAYHAWYLGLEANEAPVHTLNRDFDNTAMDAETMRAYAAAVKDAGLPVRLLLEAWQQGGRISPDADLDVLELEMMAGTMAREEAEAMEAERRRAEFDASQAA